MIRRFNYTGRKKMPRSKVSISLNEGPEKTLTFDATVDLEGLPVSPSANIYIEAHRRAYFNRFPCGTVSAPRFPRGRILEGLESNALVRFRVKVGDRVLIFQGREGGFVELSDRVHLISDIYIVTGQGGSLKIGSDTFIQPRCQFSAYLAPIEIGCKVQISPNCAFYPYNHRFFPEKAISEQQLYTKGGIIIEDDAWLGYGVIVLDGVRIGRGAVIGAGSVITKDVPSGAIAVGNPARVIRMRQDMVK